MRTISIIILLVLVLASFANSKEENQDEKFFANSAYQQLIEKLRQIEVEDLAELNQKQKATREAKERLEKIEKMKVANKEVLTKSLEELDVLVKIAREELEKENNLSKELEQEYKQRRIEVTNEKRELEKYMTAWQEDRSEGKLTLLAGAITKIASKYNITANVRWKTTPKPGALIYFQTIRQRDKGAEPSSLNNLSETTEVIVIGYYYIWAVRNGKPTSDMNRKIWITEQTPQVTIVENSQK